MIEKKGLLVCFVQQLVFSICGYMY